MTSERLRAIAWLLDRLAQEKISAALWDETLAAYGDLVRLANEFDTVTKPGTEAPAFMGAVERRRDTEQGEPEAGRLFALETAVRWIEERVTKIEAEMRGRR